MKHLSAVLLALCLCSVAFASSRKDRDEYVRKYSPIAVSEMKRSGVPASITLAQGILESDAGLAVLATKANNHFGIKCHSDWKGATIYKDDDAPNECFRSYRKAEESFRDHSDFLRFRDRYKKLFDLKTTDYKGWAKGLKAAGYATDPHYPSKLIKIIEELNLGRFDDGELDLETPLAIESARPVESADAEVIQFSLATPVFEKNGVPFVFATEGDSYKALAEQYGLLPSEIRRFNEVSSTDEPVPGFEVYLKPKKNKAAIGIDKYIVESDGELVSDIARRFAIKSKALNALNSFPKGHVLKQGDTVILR